MPEHWSDELRHVMLAQTGATRKDQRRNPYAYDSVVRTGWAEALSGKSRRLPLYGKSSKLRSRSHPPEGISPT